MPLLSTFGAASARGWIPRGGPLTIRGTGATLTQDATYYYYTYTTSTTTHGSPTGAFSVSNGSVPVDYLLVGGGGWGGTSTMSYVGTFFDGYGNPFTGYIFTGGDGGGAGGVLTGNMTLNSGSYNISIGAAGAYTGSSDSNNPIRRGRNSSAFGLTAYGGGAGGDSYLGAIRSGGSAAALGFSNEFYSDDTMTTTVSPSPLQGSNGSQAGNSTYRWTYQYGAYYASCYTQLNYGLIDTYFNYAGTGYSCLQGYGTGGGALGPGIGGAGYSGYATSVWKNGNFTNQTHWDWTANMGGSTTSPDGLSSLGLKVGFGGDSHDFWRNSTLALQANLPNTGSGGGYTNGSQAGVLRVRIAKSSLPVGAVVGVA